MLGHLRKHVIQEANASLNVVLARTIQVYLHRNVRLICLSLDLGSPVPQQKMHK
jgi:hypothetical protein